MRDYTTVPAAPGYFACEPVLDDEGSVTGIEENPVLAWLVMNVDIEDALKGQSFAIPVCFDSIGEVLIIKTPEGTYSDLLSGLNGMDEDEAFDCMSIRSKRQEK